MSIDFDRSELREGWYSDLHSWHFQRRLWERRGIRLRYGEYAAILKKIKAGKIKEIKNGWYRIGFRNSYLIIGISQDHPSTVLEKDAFRQGPDGKWRRPMSIYNFRKRLHRFKCSMRGRVNLEEYDDDLEVN